MQASPVHVVIKNAIFTEEDARRARQQAGAAVQDFSWIPAARQLATERMMARGDALGKTAGAIVADIRPPGSGWYADAARQVPAAGDEIRELVPRVFERSSFDAFLEQEDHHGFWLQAGAGPWRLLRKDYVASLELKLPREED